VPQVVRTVGLAGVLSAWLAASAGWISRPQATIGSSALVLVALTIAQRSPRQATRSPGSWRFLRPLTHWRPKADREPGRYVYRCYLRGEPPHLPDRWRRGWLYLAGGTLVWRPDWHRIEQILTRPLTLAEAPVTSNEDLAALKTGRFQLFQAESAAGSAFRLAVPSTDVVQVTSLLQAI
jgi:hypothetical protein